MKNPGKFLKYIYPAFFDETQKSFSSEVSKSVFFSLIEK